MIPKFSTMLRVDARAALSPVMISGRPRIQYRCIPRTERHTSKSKPTMYDRLPSSFLFPSDVLSSPKWEIEKHQVCPSRPTHQRINAASCVVHGNQLRATGRTLPHRTEDVGYLKIYNAGWANSPRISSAILTNSHARPIKYVFYCLSRWRRLENCRTEAPSCTSTAAYFNQIIEVIICNIRLTAGLHCKEILIYVNFAKASTSHPSIPLFNEKGETKSKSLRHGRTLASFDGGLLSCTSDSSASHTLSRYLKPR